jgi:hypothetical protein
VKRGAGSLYKRDGSPFWWADFRWNGKRYQVSTKIGFSDVDAAQLYLAQRLSTGPLPRDPRLSNERRRALKARSVFSSLRRSCEGVSVTAEVVYAVAAGGLVKFGRTRQLRRRMESLQTGSPLPLTLVAAKPGGSRMEREAHRAFAAKRRHGEWFAISMNEARVWLESAAA